MNKLFYYMSLIFGSIGTVITVITAFSTADDFIGISGTEGLSWIAVWFLGAIWARLMSK